MKSDARMAASESCHQGIDSRLAHANRMSEFEQLTAFLSDEMKQPISAILIYAKSVTRWLTASPPNVVEIQKSLDGIAYNAARLNETIDKARAFFKRDADRVEEIQLADAINEVIQILCVDMKEGYISITSSLEDTLPLVLGDRLRLQQVILNLMHNAIHTVQNGSCRRELRIVARQSASDCVRIEISDSRSDVDAIALEQLFASLQERNIPRLGEMELLISCAILEAHGSALFLRRREAQGMTFEFDLKTLASRRLNGHLSPRL